MSSNIYQIDKLNKNNYETWKIQVKMVLIHSELWNYTNGSIKKQAEGNDGDNEWITKDEKALAIIVLSISPSLLHYVKNCSTSKDAWDSMEKMFQPTGPCRKVQLTKQLINIRKKPDQSMEEHVRKFSQILDQLHEIKSAPSDDFATILLLTTLPEEYEVFRCSIECRDELPTLETLKIKILEEADKKESSTSRNDNFSLISKSKDTLNKTNSVKFCKICKRRNHDSKDCYFKKKNSSSLCLDSCDNDSDTVLSSLEINNRKSEFLLDSGATSHMCNKKDLFIEYEECKLGEKVRVADGSLVEIKGKGTVRIHSIVNDKIVPIQLKETLYLPELKTNLISISKATKNENTKAIFYENNACIVKIIKLSLKQNKIKIYILLIY